MGRQPPHGAQTASFSFPREGVKPSSGLSSYRRVEGSVSGQNRQGEGTSSQHGLGTLRNTVISHKGGNQPDVSETSEPL